MLCTNAYSINIDPYFIGKVIPTRAQCLVTAPLNDPSIFGTCGYSDYGYMYYRTTFDGRLLIGGGRKQNRALENDTTDDRITDPVQRILDTYLREKFPDVDVPVDRRWSVRCPDAQTLASRWPSTGMGWHSRRVSRNAPSICCLMASIRGRLGRHGWIRRKSDESGDFRT